MLNLSRKALSRIAIVLGIMILIMATFAIVTVFADSGQTAGQTQITAEQSEDGYITNAASEDSENTLIGLKSIATGIAIGVAAGGGGIGMGVAASGASQGIARQPEAEGKIRTNFMLGRVFIETAIIYALLVVILIIFVL